jgi:hypothetical protein
MAKKKPSIHKTLLILILVFLPPYWLIFTDDGTRLTDTALLWLLGEDEIKFNVRELDSSFTREDIQKVFSDNEWHCGEKETPFGNSLCAAQIGAFNGYPSRLLTLYFRDDNISAFKLIYHEPYHDQLMGFFIEQFGQPDNVAEVIAAGPGAGDVLEWKLDHGVLLMPRALGEKDEPSLLWLAAGPGAGVSPETSR